MRDEIGPQNRGQQMPISHALLVQLLADLCAFSRHELVVMAKLWGQRGRNSAATPEKGIQELRRKPTISLVGDGRASVCPFGTGGRHPVTGLEMLWARIQTSPSSFVRLQGGGYRLTAGSLAKRDESRTPLYQDCHLIAIAVSGCPITPAWPSRQWTSATRDRCRAGQRVVAECSPSKRGQCSRKMRIG